MAKRRPKRAIHIRGQNLADLRTMDTQLARTPGLLRSLEQALRSGRPGAAFGAIGSEIAGQMLTEGLHDLLEPLFSLHAPRVPSDHPGILSWPASGAFGLPDFGTPPIAPTEDIGIGLASGMLGLGLTATDLHDWVKGGAKWYQVDDSWFSSLSKNPSSPASISTIGGTAQSPGIAPYAQGALGLYGITQSSPGGIIGSLSGAISGFEMGNAIVPGAGGIVGGVLGGIAGLFGGHHSGPQPELDQQLNPALYNAPSNFSEGAFMWRATDGRLYSVQQQWFQQNFPAFNTNAPFASSAQLVLANAPVVHVYVDGAEVAQKSVVQGILGGEIDSSYLVSTHDYRRPI